MRHPEYSGQFKRDLKRAKKRGQDMEKIKAPIQLLIDEKPLPASYGDHPFGWDGKDAIKVNYADYH